MSKEIEVTKTNAPPQAVSVMEPFSTMRREMERLFDHFADTIRYPQLLGKTWGKMLSTTEMVVDVSEDDKSYTITAEPPGISEKDIRVSISNDVLPIKAEKEQEKEDKNKNHSVRERAYGVFQRSFSMPAGVNAEDGEAKFAKGVLTLVLPKSAEASKVHKIEVRAAA